MVMFRERYSQEEIENLYEHHEDLIWAANQHFVIPAYILQELSVAMKMAGKRGIEGPQSEIRKTVIRITISPVGRRKMGYC